MRTKSAGRYFYKQPNKTRLEQGELRGEDTLWSVYLLENASGCSDNLAARLLVNPILSSASINKLRSIKTEITRDEVITIQWVDTTGPGWDGRHPMLAEIDTSRWVITRFQEKTGSGYPRYDASFGYSMLEDSIPVLEKIAFNGDTTLAKGGFDFHNIVVNEPIDDSLFESGSSIRFGEPGPGVSTGARAARPAVLFSVDETGKPARSGMIYFDVLGRRYGKRLNLPIRKRAFGIMVVQPKKD